jgi:dihydroxy-acid dehydratase
VRDGVRDEGGIALEFPTHPVQETGRRPTAALDRNLIHLGLVEILHGYPIDGVVLTTGCDKTTPAMLMAAATANTPAIVLSGGPMLDGRYNGELAGAGTVIWKARERLAAGDIDYDEFMALATASAPSIGHCNTMGTALSMNSLAEALGMSLPGCAAIPAPYRERSQIAYRTGARIVEMVREDLRPDAVMTRAAFENAIVVASALGASTNCAIHLLAIARHIGVELSLEDWHAFGHDVPLLVDTQPNGRFLAEAFHRAGGVPAVMAELGAAGRVRLNALTVTGTTLADNLVDASIADSEVIRPFSRPLRPNAGFVVLHGNFFDSAIMKISSIDDAYESRFYGQAGGDGIYEGTVTVFEGPEDYHARIDDPSLAIDQNTILVMRGCGPVGYPGSAEVVNMLPPARLVRAGITALPCLGDGRQSGTSPCPAILHMTPESSLEGGSALLHDGDRLRIDLRHRRLDLLVDQHELARRVADTRRSPCVPSQTPWQELYRQTVGPLDTGACLESAVGFRAVADAEQVPRHSH